MFAPPMSRPIVALIVGSCPTSTIDSASACSAKIARHACALKPMRDARVFDEPARHAQPLRDDGGGLPCAKQRARNDGIESKSKGRRCSWPHAPFARSPRA